MMAGIAMGPLVLGLLLIGAFVLATFAGGRRRRRGRMIFAALFLLLAMLGTTLFFARATRTRAVAERERAVAMRDAALFKEQSLGILKTEAPDATSSNVPYESDDEASDEALDPESIAAVVDDVNNAVNDEVNTVNSETKATSHALLNSEKPQTRQVLPPKPPRPPGVTRVEYQYSSSRQLDQSPRTQVLTGILLAGVVLAGYFFLNANTRGHFTWSLRIGSTLVFLFSLAISIILTNRL